MNFPDFRRAVLTPYWQEGMREWASTRGPIVQQWTKLEKPGMTNLLWLAIIGQNLPTAWDHCLVANPLCNYIIHHAERLRINGRTLEELAAFRTLEGFHLALMYRGLPTEVEELRHLTEKLLKRSTC